MAIKAGVWIDHTQAIVVLVTDAGTEVKKLKSDLEKRPRATGRAKSATPYTKNDFLAEDRREDKIEDHRKKYYDEVIACLRGAEAIPILGPGEAKGEFSKRIKTEKLRVGVELETTDKMSDREIASKVVEHFATTTAHKSASPRKTVKKKAAKATAGQRTKKSRK